MEFRQGTLSVPCVTSGYVADVRVPTLQIPRSLAFIAPFLRFRRPPLDDRASDSGKASLVHQLLYPRLIL